MARLWSYLLLLTKWQRITFGAAKVSDLNITKPIELSKPILIPKINVKVEKPEELLQKTEVKQAEVKETVPEVKKVTKPRTKKK